MARVMASRNTDHCRSFINWARSMRSRLNPEMMWRINDLVELSKVATKFMLPDGGILFSDPKMKAIDAVLPLRLPFPCIALEYTVSRPSTEGEAVAVLEDGHLIRRHNQDIQCRKRIVIAHEDRVPVYSADGQYDGVRTVDAIAVHCVSFADCWSQWVPMPVVCFEAARPIKRDGETAVYMPFDSTGNIEDRWADYADETNALFSFLNVLGCGNVGISSAGKTKKRHQKIGALPFDEYHVLTIPSARSSGLGESFSTAHHRSPREHLRRGHIRHCASGVRVWVNAAVVNPGARGAVSKVYRLPGAANR